MTAVPDPDVFIGRTVAGRYVVNAKLGQGGMGAIYLATQQPLGRQIVLKVLLASYAADPTAVQRFEKEALAISRLVHPNVVTIYDFGHTESGELFIAMEYIPGQSLRDLLDQRGPMPWAQSLHVMRGILQGLAEAHRHNIVHRDLKPENVMLTRSGSDEHFPKILDFGLARSLEGEEQDQRLTTRDMIPGTPAYIAPERVNGMDDDARSDLYSLGAMWFELLTGRAPYVAVTPVKVIVAHMQEPIPALTDVVPGLDVPPGLAHIIRQLLAKGPEDRPPSAGDVVRLIDNLDSLDDSEPWAAQSPGQAGAGAALGGLRAWAEDLGDEIPDLDFGAALGLHDDEPVLLTSPKPAEPIALTQRKGATHAPVPEDTSEHPTMTKEATAHLVSAPPAVSQAPTGPLTSLSDAATRLGATRSLGEVAQVVVAYLASRFDRALMLDVHDGGRKCEAHHGFAADNLAEAFAACPDFSALVDRGETYYGAAIDSPAWARLYANLSGKRPGAQLVATLRKDGKPALVVYAEHDQAALHDDLSDAATLLREAAAAYSRLAL